MVISFIGPSGSGKDTHAQKLAQDYGFQVISTGDLLRDISDGDSKIQQIIKRDMKRGFMPNYIVHGLLEVYLDGIKNENVQNIILTGAVRFLSQVELLDEVLANVSRKLVKVVYFKVDDQLVVERLSGRLVCKNGHNFHVKFLPPKQEGICDTCGAPLFRRDDDEPESIVKRLKAFHQESDAIIEKYKERGVLVEVNASQDVEDIYKDLKEVLELK